MTLENGEYMYRVLVVEPDKFYKESILKLLSELDYDLAVESVSSGDAAIEFAANNCIDILISEILVEDMDGFTLIDEIKEINKNLKFIIVSGNNEFSNVKKAIKLGAIDYIHKPFEKNELVDAVDIAISKCDESKTIIEQSDINNEFIKEHILFNLLYGKKIDEIKIEGEYIADRNEFDKYKRIVLIEFNSEFFNEIEDFEKFFKEFLENNNIYCHYINLNSTQSVLLLDKS